jgi:ribosome-associated protein
LIDRRNRRFETLQRQPDQKKLAEHQERRYNTGVRGYNAHQFAMEIARIVHDTKCEDVVALDLREITPVADFTVIATGTSSRQIRAVAETVQEYARKLGQKPYGFAGAENGVWVVIDFVDVVVHLFSRTHRSYYDLELLWGDAPRLAWVRSETA